MSYLEVGRCYQAILQHLETVVLQNQTWKIKMSNLLKKICGYTYTHTHSMTITHMVIHNYKLKKLLQIESHTFYANPFFSMFLNHQNSSYCYDPYRVCLYQLCHNISQPPATSLSEQCLFNSFVF